MHLKFTKMQGAGNDFIFLNAIAEKMPPDLPEFTKKICHRQFGVGADQVLIVSPSATHDFRMDIYNADGGRVEMCGNGIRCFAKFVRDKKLTDKTELTVETLAGTIVPQLIPDHPKQTAATAWVRVDMGVPVTEGAKIPTTTTGEIVARTFYIDHPSLLEGEPGHVVMTCVSMGNPHAVIFVDNVARYPVERIGRIIENHAFFPNRTNVEFVQINDRRHVVQRTWERGSGETLACGTGASAVCVAGVLNGLTERDVTITLKGGDLELSWDAKSGHVYKTGPATTVFEGEIIVESGYKNHFTSQIARLKK